MSSPVKIDRKKIAARLFSGEKSLRDVVRTFRNAFEQPFSAGWLALLSFSVAMIIAWYNIAYGVAGDTDSAASVTGRNVVAAGKILSVLTQFSGAIFGVAIAGFSIFASMMDERAALRLSSSVYPKTDVPVIRVIFSLFIFVMVVLLAPFPTALVFFLFFDSDALISIADFPDRIANWISAGFYGLVLAQAVYTLSIIVSFIWNLHQILLLSAAIQIAEPDD